MNITADTADTTNEEILAQVTWAKGELLQKATDAMNSNLVAGDALLAAAKNVGTFEALASVQIQYRNLLSQEDSDIYELGFLIDQIRYNGCEAVVAWAHAEAGRIRYES